MTTIDPRAAAIEAAARAYYGVNGYDWREEIDEGDRAVILREFTEVVAAAVPHLTAGLHDLADEWDNRRNRTDDDQCQIVRCGKRLREALDALERGGEQ